MVNIMFGQEEQTAHLPILNYSCPKAVRNRRLNAEA